jgi:CRP/FNR family transcriptional regulator, cyclic AMP receptor protein
VTGATARFKDRVLLAEVDPDLLRGTPEEELPLVRRVLHCPAEHVERGPWEPAEAERSSPEAFAVLVIEGLMAWDVTLSGRVSTVLLGPGDVFSPWIVSDSLIEPAVRYTALTACRLAVLDGRFLLASRRWPALVVRLNERMAAQARRSAVDAALTHLPNAELRVLGALWHLADRWGRMASAGVILPLKLTHEALGRMIGAERPTVTLALRDLARNGMVERREDGGWLLRHDSLDAIVETGAVADEPAEPAAAAIVESLRPRLDRAAVRRRDDAEDPVLEPSEIVAFAAELRETLQQQRARLGDLLLQNREVVEHSMVMRAEITQRRLEAAEQRAGIAAERLARQGPKPAPPVP